MPLTVRTNVVMVAMSITMCLSFALNVFLKVVCGNMKGADKFERWSAKEHKNLQKSAPRARIR